MKTFECFEDGSILNIEPYMEDAVVIRINDLGVEVAACITLKQAKALAKRIKRIVAYLE